MDNEPQINKAIILQLTCLISGRLDKLAIKKVFSNENSYLPLLKLANQNWLLSHVIFEIKKKECWHLLPEQVQEYMLSIQDVYVQRAKVIELELTYLADSLKPTKIPMVLLKGAAALLNTSSSPANIRYMTDIDVLIPENKLELAKAQLELNGYLLDDENFDYKGNLSHQLSPIKRRESLCYIELHRWPLSFRAKALLNTQDVWKSAIEIKESDLGFNQLAPTHQIILEIAHSEISDGGHRANFLSLQKLVNLYLMINYWENIEQKPIDWPAINSAFIESGFEQVLQARLHMLHELFELTTPITQLQNENAQKHVKSTLSRYERKQSDANWCFEFVKLFASYEKELLLSRYGHKGQFPLLRASCYQLYAHWQKLFNFIKLKLNIN